MANIVNSALVEEIRGRIAATAFQRVTGGGVARTRGGPRGSASDLQERRRNRFAWVTSQWQSLSQSVRDQWAQSAAQLSRSEGSAAVLPSGGFSAFVEMQMAFETVDGAPLVDPPLMGERARSCVPILFNGAGGLWCVGGSRALGALEFWQLRTLDEFPASRRSPRRRVHDLQIVIGGTTSPIGRGAAALLGGGAGAGVPSFPWVAGGPWTLEVWWNRAVPGAVGPACLFDCGAFRIELGGASNDDILLVGLGPVYVLGTSTGSTWQLLTISFDPVALEFYTSVNGSIFSTTANPLTPGLPASFGFGHRSAVVAPSFAGLLGLLRVRRGVHAGSYGSDEWNGGAGRPLEDFGDEVGAWPLSGSKFNSFECYHGAAGPLVTDSEWTLNLGPSPVLVYDAADMRLAQPRFQVEGRVLTMDRFPSATAVVREPA